jgi:hypothetical protein
MLVAEATARPAAVLLNLVIWLIGLVTIVLIFRGTSALFYRRSSMNMAMS